MAKSFSTTGRGVPAKALSERDFFDLTEEPVAPTNSPLVAAAEPVAQADSAAVGEAVSNTRNTVITGRPVSPDKPANGRIPGNSKSKKNRRVADNTSNTDNAVNPLISSNKVITDNPELLISPAGTLRTTKGGDVRQTFVMSRGYLEQLRDYVHARRASGDYTYSQKQALQEALDFFFQHRGLVEPRPSEAREREQHHQERIKEGRQTRVARDLP